MCGCVKRSTRPQSISIVQRFNTARFTPQRDDLRSVNGREWRPIGMSALLMALMQTVGVVVRQVLVQARAA